MISSFLAMLAKRPNPCRQTGGSRQLDAHSPFHVALRPATAVALLLLATSLGFAQRRQPPYQTRADVIVHFAQLVEWPPNALPANAPLVICTLDDSYSAALDWAVDGKQIREHPIQTRHILANEYVRGCHMLIIGADEKVAAAALASLKDASVLTVSESLDFVDAGGIIGLAPQDNNIRFDINLDAAHRANLKISSRLLLLARNVISAGKRE